MATKDKNDEIALLYISKENFLFACLFYISIKTYSENELYILELCFSQPTVELQWLEHLCDYEDVFETGVVRAIEGLL